MIPFALSYTMTDLRNINAQLINNVAGDCPHLGNFGRRSLPELPRAFPKQKAWTMYI